MTKSTAAFTAALVAALLTGTALAEPLPKVDPGEVGLSQAQLERVGERLRADVEAGTIPGAVLLILRDDKIGYLEAFGHRDREAAAPMKEDAIFRIYSMTKPITSVVAMQLVEEGKLALEDPVAKYIPSFGDTQVGEVESDGSVSTRAASSPVTVHDLLRHTSGITYGVFGSSPIKDMYKEARIGSGTMSGTDEAKALSGLPLVMDPGKGWEYGRSTDVLGAVIEAVENKPLGEVMKARIFDPLEMNDTAFHVADEADRERVAQPQKDPETGKAPTLLDETKAPVYESGGGGLFSTARDYARFAAAMLNGGELDGARILSPQTVRYMTADHMGDIPHGVPDGVATIGYLPGPGYGFGLGFAVRTDDGVSPRPGNKGEYRWGGYAGTDFWADPKEDLAVVYMMQAPSKRGMYRPLLRNLIYPAVMPMPESKGTQ